MEDLAEKRQQSGNLIQENRKNDLRYTINSILAMARLSDCIESFVNKKEKVLMMITVKDKGKKRKKKGMKNGDEEERERREEEEEEEELNGDEDQIEDAEGHKSMIKSYSRYRIRNQFYSTLPRYIPVKEVKINQIQMNREECGNRKCNNGSIRMYSNSNSLNRYNSIG
ncbi:hypothetical protein ACTA71_011219 [Dictyostelium dimigraforme]